MELDRLRLISSIRPGQTLSTSSMSIVPHRSWRTSYSRRLAGDNRVKTRDAIVEIVTTGLEIILKAKENQGYIELLEDTALSLQFLGQTYEGDPETVSIFRQLREKVLLFLKGYVTHRGRQYIADTPYTIFQLENMNLPMIPIVIEKKGPAGAGVSCGELPAPKGPVIIACTSKELPPLIRFDSIERVHHEKPLDSSANSLSPNHELKYHMMAILPERLFQMSPPQSLDSSVSSSRSFSSPPPSPPQC